MPNLIQTVMNAFTPDVTSRLAGAMGDSQSAVTGGLGAATPALLAGALQRSASPAGARSLLDLVDQAKAGGDPLDRIGSAVSDDSARTSYLSHGQTLASGLLGGNSSAVASAVSSHAGVGMGSAANLLALAAPVVLGALGRAAGPAPTPAGLQSVLNKERGNILGALPSGLGSLFGLGGGAERGASRAASADAFATHAVSAGAGTAHAARPGIGRWLPWIVGAVVLLGLIMAMRNCAAQREVAPPLPSAPETTAQAPPAAPMPTVGAPNAPVVTLNLPGGGNVNVPQGSIGFVVARFLESGEPAPKTFIFDNLNYDTASRSLTPASRPTVSSLATILSAYPNTVVRVVGYTDNQGDPASNKTLSEQRAGTVKAELVRLGIPDERIESAGMGEANPVADNSTEAGRAQNRRTELVIVKK